MTLHSFLGLVPVLHGLVLGPLGAAQAPAPAPDAHAADEHRGRMQVHVVREGEERGAAGIAVRVFDASDRRWLPEALPMQSIELMRRHLPGTATDADGNAWQPEPNGRFSAFAESEGWFGLASGRTLPEGPFEIALRPDPLLRVKVVERGGNAVAGMKVALLGAGGRAGFTLLEVALTDAAGIAAFRPLRWRDNEHAQRMSVAAVHADPAAQVRNVDLTRLPGEPLELVLGPTATIEVALVQRTGAEAAGTAVDVVGHARIDVRDPAPDTLAAALRGFVTAPWERGRARFAHVPVGLDLVVRPVAPGVVFATAEEAEPEGGEDEDQENEEAKKETERALRIDEDGARHELVFPVSTTPLALRARLLGAPGTPLTETPVSMRRQGAERDERVLTDDRGFIASAFSPAAEPGAPVRVELATVDPQGTRLAALVVLEPGEVRLHDLGDILLAPAPLIAAGMVVDERDQPLVRAEVQVFELPAGATKHRLRRDLLAVTDIAGRFALHGAVEGKLFVEASHARARAGTKVAVEPGSAGVRLALARTGAIEASARFDEGREVEVLFQAFDANGRIAGRSSLERGLHLVEGLAPGEYTLRCKWGAGGDAILAEVAGIVVHPGRTTRDPRCAPLDLAGKVHPIALELGTASGTAPESVFALVRERGGPRAFGVDGQAVAGGRTTLRSPWPAVELELRASGFRTVLLADVSGSASATFEPGLPVRLALDPAALERLGGRVLTVRLAFEGASYARPTAAAVFDRDGRAELRVCDPGRYNVQLELAEERPGLTPLRRNSGSSQRVEVREGEAQETVIDLASEYVRARLGL